MDFSLTEEQEMLKKTARDFLVKECPESLVREIEDGEDGYSPELWRKVADLGWLGLVFPEKYGGTGGSILDLSVLYEEMGRAMLPSPYMSTVVLCGLTILEAGSEEQKANLLPKIANGNLILAFALTEPEPSWDGKFWDAEGITVSASRKKDHFLLNGTKMFVRDTQIADYLLVAAKTSTGSKAENGITIFLVNTRSPGINSVLLKTVAGDKQSEVTFDEVRVPAENMIGRLNEGWPILAKVLRSASILLCAEMVGIGQRALEIATDYAKTRVQFDMPIGINQYVQEHCVCMLADVDSSRLATQIAAWKISAGLSHDFEVYVAKAWVNEAIEMTLWRGHQVMAGAGVTTDAGVFPLLSRRAKGLQLYIGDTKFFLEKVAQEMDKWPAPEKPRGKPLGIWNLPEEQQIPAWQPWRERWTATQTRKEERLKRKAQNKQGN